MRRRELGQFDDRLQNGTPGQRDLLKELDILIDGPYIHSEKAPLKWRGSQNQRIHLLADRYSPENIFTEDQKTEVELVFQQESGTLITTGFPEASFENDLIEALSRFGLEIQPVEECNEE